MMKVNLLVIVASTGGPKALEEICKGFSSDMKTPILIVQHLPFEYTSTFINYLNRHCQLDVKAAQNDEPIVPGKILIAPGGHNIKVVKSKQGKNIIQIESSVSAIRGIKPSADVLFHSIANVFDRERVLAVVLTGIGTDGTKGIKKLKEAGLCYCISQDKESSAVYGMPKSIMQAGLSDEIVHLYEMSSRIKQIVS